MATPAITLRQLEYFVCVAELGTVTAAAEQIHLSQSAMSTAIADLERLLGVQLFVRHARGLALTRDGELILREARRLLRDAEDLQHSAANLSGDLSGSVYVGCYPTIAPLLLPRVIAEFTTRHPQVSINFREGYQDELLRRLGRGECDLAVTYNYRLDRDLAESGFTTTHLASVPPYVLLNADHDLADQATVSLAKLAEEPMILLDVPPSSQYFISLFESIGLEPNIRFRTSNYELVRGLVARGMGFSILNQRPAVTKSYEGIDYVTVGLDERHRPLEVVAVTPDDQRLSERVSVFIDEAARLLTNSPLRAIDQIET